MSQLDIFQEDPKDPRESELQHLCHFSVEKRLHLLRTDCSAASHGKAVQPQPGSFTAPVVPGLLNASLLE